MRIHRQVRKARPYLGRAYPSAAPERGRHRFHTRNLPIRVLHAAVPPSQVRIQPGDAHVGGDRVPDALLVAPVQRRADRRRQYARSARQQQQQREPGVLERVARHVPQAHRDPYRRAAHQDGYQVEQRLRGRERHQDGRRREQDGGRVRVVLPQIYERDRHDDLRRRPRRHAHAPGRPYGEPVRRREPAERRDGRNPCRRVSGAYVGYQHGWNERRKRRARRQVDKPQRLPAYVAYEHREYAEEQHPKREQEQRGRYQQRFVHVLLSEQPARDQLSPRLEFPVQRAGYYQEQDVYVVALDYRNRRGPRRPEPVDDETGARSQRSGNHEYGEAKPARDRRRRERQPTHVNRKRAAVRYVAEVG